MRENILNPNDPFLTVQAKAKEHLAGIPDVVPPTLGERFIAAYEQHYGPLPPEPPVTPRSLRAGCRFCHGRGCLNCDALVAQEYRRQFPNGPQPIATFKCNDPEDMQLVKTVLSKHVFEDALATNDTDAAAALILAQVRAAVQAQATFATAPREEIP